MDKYLAYIIRYNLCKNLKKWSLLFFRHCTLGFIHSCLLSRKVEGLVGKSNWQISQTVLPSPYVKHFLYRLKNLRLWGKHQKRESFFKDMEWTQTRVPFILLQGKLKSACKQGGGSVCLSWQHATDHTNIFDKHFYLTHSALMNQINISSTGWSLFSLFCWFVHRRTGQEILGGQTLVCPMRGVAVNDVGGPEASSAGKILKCRVLLMPLFAFSG